MHKCREWASRWHRGERGLLVYAAPKKNERTNTFLNKSWAHEGDDTRGPRCSTALGWTREKPQPSPQKSRVWELWSARAGLESEREDITGNTFPCAVKATVWLSEEFRHRPWQTHLPTALEQTGLTFLQFSWEVSLYLKNIFHFMTEMFHSF